MLDFGEFIGYGIQDKPDFWIGPQATGDGFRESHIAFTAPDRTCVREFFAAAVAAGAEVLHEPRLWPEYHASYYGAFVRDPDGKAASRAISARFAVITTVFLRIAQTFGRDHQI